MTHSQIIKRIMRNRGTLLGEALIRQDCNKRSSFFAEMTDEEMITWLAISKGHTIPSMCLKITYEDMDSPVKEEEESIIKVRVDTIETGITLVYASVRLQVVKTISMPISTYRAYQAGTILDTELKLLCDLSSTNEVRDRPTIIQDIDRDSYDEGTNITHTHEILGTRIL